MFGAIINHPSVLDSSVINDEKSFQTDLQNYCTCNELNKIVGFVRKTELIKKYLNIRITNYREEAGTFSGTNQLWLNLLATCVSMYLIKYYKLNKPPDIIIVYDPKSLRNKHQSRFFTFMKDEFNQFQKQFTKYDVNINFQLGSKSMTGIAIADQIVRAAFSTQVGKDLTAYIEEVVRSNPNVFR